MKNWLKTIFLQLLAYGLLAVSTIRVFLPLFKLERLKAHIVTTASPLDNVFVLGIIVLVGIAGPQLILLMMSYMNKTKRAQYQRWQSSLAMVVIWVPMFFSIPSGNDVSIDQIDALMSAIFGFMLLQYVGLAIYFIVSLGRFFSKKISKEDAVLSNVPAGFWDRIWAKCVDIAPILLAGSILLVILSSILPVWVILCLLFGFLGLRYVKNITSRKQATTGKMTAGIYVTQLESLDPITKPQAWVRYLIMYLPVLLLLLSESSSFEAAVHKHLKKEPPEAGQLQKSPDTEKDKEDALHEHIVEAYYLIMMSSIAFTKNKRGFHDRICKTRVLRGKPEIVVEDLKPLQDYQKATDANLSSNVSVATNPANASSKTQQKTPDLSTAMAATASADTFLVTEKPKNNQTIFAIVLVALITFGCWAYSVLHRSPVYNVQADKNKVYANKIAQWQTAAEAGDPKAQTMLGNAYYQGYGSIVKDTNQAIVLYQKAAQQGDPIAERSLGNMYYAGDGIAKDITEALKWLDQAAGHGDALAAVQLANIYYDGNGVSKDITESLKWEQKAAELKYPEAQRRVGNMYFNGEGTTKDDTQAVKWWQEAAEQDDKEAACNLSHAYENGVGGLQKDFIQLYKWFLISTTKGANCYNDISSIIAPMTPEQRDEAMRLAHEWKPHSFYNMQVE